MTAKPLSRAAEAFMEKRAQKSLRATISHTRAGEWVAKIEAMIDADVRKKNT